MEKRYIGDLEVSEIGMGCMGFSHGYGKIPEVDYSIQAIQKGYDFETRWCWPQKSIPQPKDWRRENGWTR